MVIVAVATLTVTNLRRSALGRSFLAVRQGELAAEALGINVARVKIIAFAPQVFMRLDIDLDFGVASRSAIDSRASFAAKAQDLAVFHAGGQFYF